MLNSRVPANLSSLLVTRRAITEMDLMPTLNQDILLISGSHGRILPTILVGTEIFILSPIWADL